jgi:hypothetical protein
LELVGVGRPSHRRGLLLAHGLVLLLHGRLRLLRILTLRRRRRARVAGHEWLLLGRVLLLGWVLLGLGRVLLLLRVVWLLSAHLPLLRVLLALRLRVLLLLLGHGRAAPRLLVRWRVLPTHRHLAAAAAPLLLLLRRRLTRSVSQLLHHAEAKTRGETYHAVVAGGVARVHRGLTEARIALRACRVVRELCVSSTVGGLKGLQVRTWLCGGPVGNCTPALGGGWMPITEPLDDGYWKADRGLGLMPLMAMNDVSCHGISCNTATTRSERSVECHAARRAACRVKP